MIIQWEIIIGFLVVWGILYLLVRKHYDKKKGLSKKGFIIMVSSIFAIFVIAFILGLLA